MQILLGAITAHYQVEGQQFYGFDISQILPYSLTRSWHTELAVLWIATAWLATGLYIAPAVSGHEPKFQRLGVNMLWFCLLIIVVGAFAGQWFAVMQKLGLANNFWFGHQGWEYVDLGRFWQIFLFVGLLLWLGLVGRALWPALRRKDEMSSIVGLLFLSTVAIALFYGAGLMWGEHTHISMVEYWRWWVVHLWVEGFFEVFAVAVISFLFVKLGLVRGTTATVNVLFATIVFMAGGVLGTFHHLYFAGTTVGVIALGASFSALEVVPLALIGMEAYETWSHGRSTPWMQRYRWPIMFFLAVSFWNLVGAGLFGFLINTPIALYYMQGLNLTALHGHTALFGVYGMLGLGLMLFCLRGMKPDAHWNEGWLRGSFWALNIGLSLMALLTLLPLGVLQLSAVLETWLLVRALGRVHDPADHPPADLDARAGRHDLRHRHAAVHLVRRAPVDQAATPAANAAAAARARSCCHGEQGRMIAMLHARKPRKAPAPGAMRRSPGSNGKRRDRPIRTCCISPLPVPRHRFLLQGRSRACDRQPQASPRALAVSVCAVQRPPARRPGRRRCLIGQHGDFRSLVRAPARPLVHRGHAGLHLAGEDPRRAGARRPLRPRRRSGRGRTHAPKSMPAPAPAISISSASPNAPPTGAATTTSPNRSSARCAASRTPSRAGSSAAPAPAAPRRRSAATCAIDACRRDCAWPSRAAAHSPKAGAVATATRARLDRP